MGREKDSDDNPRNGMAGFAQKIAQYLPEVNFITIHYGYFIGTTLVTALIFWGSSTPSRSVSFVDSLFLCASAMTEAGLNTVNLSALNTFQQVILFLLIVIGSSIFVSIFILLVRLRAFDREFEHSIKKRQDLKAQSRADARQAGRGRARSLLARRSLDEKSASESNNVANTDKAPSPVVDGNDGGFQVSQATEANGRPNLDSEQRSPKENHTRLSVDTRSIHAPQDNEVEERQQHLATRSIRFGRSPTTDEDELHPSRFPDLHPPESLQDGRSRHTTAIPARTRHPLVSFTGVGAAASSSLRPRSLSRTSTIRARNNATNHNPPIIRSSTVQMAPEEPFLKSASAFLARNSAIFGLSLHEREELGGCEYLAILVLSIIVPLYWISWQFLGAIALGAWVKNNRPDTAKANGLNPFWVGSFNAISAFNNSGMSLLDANMTAFQDSYYMILSMGLFILAGNTAYPVFLRIIIWAFYKLLPDNAFWKHDKETMRFLLEHPRRCYTNLLPSPHTWWLGASLIILNGVDWLAFTLLNIGNQNITHSLDPRIEALDGLFQALAVRCGGFYVVTITSTRISLQFLYVIMMYISAYPVAVAMRNSNIYEERSLGIFAEDLDQDDNAGKQGEDSSKDNYQKDNTSGLFGWIRHVSYAAKAPHREQRTTFVRQQLRAQLSHDAWWICLAIFLITIIEGGRFDSNPTVFSVFNVIFEVVSGYACVGISTGVPWAAFSFSGAWHSLSKLVLIVVMIRGRHRGLPVAIDHAVQLPGQKLWLAEEDDGRRRLERSSTMRDGQV